MPWLSDTDCLRCFICKNGIKDAGHFFFDCMSFRKNFVMLWYNLKTTLFNTNPLESNFVFSFLQNLDRKHKTMFLLGGLSLPFDSNTTIIMKRVVSTAVGKIYKIHSPLNDFYPPLKCFCNLKLFKTSEKEKRNNRSLFTNNRLSSFTPKMFF